MLPFNYASFALCLFFLFFFPKSLEQMLHYIFFYIRRLIILQTIQRLRNPCTAYTSYSMPSLWLNERWPNVCQTNVSLTRGSVNHTKINVRRIFFLYPFGNPQSVYFFMLFVTYSVYLQVFPSGNLSIILLDGMFSQSPNTSSCVVTMYVSCTCRCIWWICLQKWASWLLCKEHFMRRVYV